MDTRVNNPNIDQRLAAHRYRGVVSLLIGWLAGWQPHDWLAGSEESLLELKCYGNGVREKTMSGQFSFTV